MITLHDDPDFYGNTRRIIQGSEDFKSHVYADSSNIPTIGYGYAMVVKNKNTFQVDDKNIWKDFAAIGIAKTDALKDKLDAIINDLNNTSLTDKAK